MATRAIAKFGVYGMTSQAERDVLALADAYRRELCALHQEWFDWEIDYRNRAFPELFSALGLADRIFWKIAAVEREIKGHHSDVRDRNAVTPEQEATLRALREERKAVDATIRRERTAWLEHCKAWRDWFKAQADWKNVKTRANRVALYAQLSPPAEIAEYGAAWMAWDARKRDLDEAYQGRGLHSAIRAEICDASGRKLKKDGPGIRYRYGRLPEVKPWRKLSLQLVGGKTFGELIAGTPQLRIEPVYTNHPAGGAEMVAIVTQQIGTSGAPRWIEYRMKFDRSIDPETRFQWWSLVVGDDGRRTVVPVATGLAAKPTGKGRFGFRLCWTQRKGGIEVARLWGEHVNERLVLPQWLVDKRLCATEAQAVSDGAANDLLTRRGLNMSRPPGEPTGVEALKRFVAEHPHDGEAGNLLDRCLRRLEAAKRSVAQAVRCIEDIYRTVAARVCRLHDAINVPDIDLARAKRYDTRDLLRVDPIPAKARENMHAVAVGKLKALLEGWGLASVDVPPEPPGDARETDLFTSYVASLGKKTGTKPSHPCHRSQMGPQWDVA